MMLTLILSMLTLAFNIQPSGAERLSISQSIPIEDLSVIPPENMTYLLKDHRVIEVPGGLFTDGLLAPLINEYPYSDFASLVTELSSPYPGSVYIYNYSNDSFRKLPFFTGPFAGGFSSPGTVTSLTEDYKTYLFTASEFLGEGSPYEYQGANISWPFSAVIDYPDFKNITSLNLVLPAAQLGYSPNQSLWVQRSWSLDGYNLYGYSELSRFIGGTPRGKYLYFVNLTTPEFLDFTKLHEVFPTKEIPWDSPIGFGFFSQVNENVLLHVRWGSDIDNYVFYDLTNDAWKVFTSKGWHIVWHKKDGGYLYLLIQQSEESNYYRYIFNRVNLTDLNNLEKLTINPIETIWEKTFHKDYENYYPMYIVRDNRIYIFEGSRWGYPPTWGPVLDSVYAYELIDGKLVSEEDLNIKFPQSRSSLRSVQYPCPSIDVIYGSFIVDFDRNSVYAINLSDVEDFITQQTGLSLSEFCYYSFFITDYDPSKINLLAMIYDYLSESGYLTSISVEFKTAPIKAAIDADPDTLQLRSKGKWITCHVELPRGYNVSDIDVSTIKLNQTIPIDLAAPTEIGDHDNDAILDLMVKLDRTIVSKFIVSKGIIAGNAALTITGQLNDGKLFAGSDIIKVR